MSATTQDEKYGYEWGVYSNAFEAVRVLCASGETMTEPADPRNTAYREEHIPRQDALQAAAQEYGVEYSAIGRVLFNKTVQLALGEAALPDNDWVLDAYATITVPLTPIKTSYEELTQELVFQRIHVGSQKARSEFDYINNGKQSRIYFASEAQLALRVVHPTGGDSVQHIADYDIQSPAYGGGSHFKIGAVYGDGPGILRCIPESSWRYTHVAGLMLDAYTTVQDAVTPPRTSVMVFDTAQKFSERLDAR
ncbi:MAG: hypothetical protein JWL89_52 [Candidatus Saccharibacteria bacterium]|nr:hypothetical protein [Candidatus Saccharibacteria bacterium]